MAQLWSMSSWYWAAAEAMSCCLRRVTATSGRWGWCGFDFYENEGIGFFGDDVDLGFVGRPVGLQDGVAGRNEVFRAMASPSLLLPCRWIFRCPARTRILCPVGWKQSFGFLNNPVMAAFKNFKTLLMRL